MTKRIHCLLLAAILVFSAGCAGQPAQPSQETIPPTEPGQITPQETVALPQLDTAAIPPRHRGVAVYDTTAKAKGITITPRIPASAAAANGIEPYSDFWYTTTVPADLSGHTALAYTLIVSDNTQFFGNIPAGYDRDALIQWGKAPGLNVEVLHRHGFTGKGAVIAYIDQPLSYHPEYQRDNVHIINTTGRDISMHGPMVLSLLTGRTIGTAPEAEVYFYASYGNGDQITHAQALYALIEQNKTLPEGEKITMVGFSDNIDHREANVEAFREAVKACEESGVMVFFCGDYGSGAFLPMSDKNDYRNLIPDQWYSNGTRILVPAGGRTGVNPQGGGEYTYWSSGGLSWTMPYVLGLYAMATEIRPELTKQQLLSLLSETAYHNNGRRIVNPVGFVARVLTDAGREEEAQVLLEEAAYNRRYTYAVMNKSRMTQEDLAAVENYFARLTDTTILIVDVKSGTSAQDLYRTLQADAWERDGIVEGVQIFGTPDMVSAFQPGYKVQMTDSVDQMGTMYSDLFYGNFLNDADLLKNYNVMDHFAQGWDITLAPSWPVARLPLKPGEYSAFFTKYHTFLRSTRAEPPQLVNFSNPIFQQTRHTDDMAYFLSRLETEFDVLDSGYRLYGNQDGEFPVSGPVLGNFLPENLAKENEAAVCEFLINSHGQRNNIDQAIFADGREQRTSFLNSRTIDSVLDSNPYYLDCWTCNNGEGMSDNLTTAALNGQAVGVFSSTHVISNNGADCYAAFDDLPRSNFYYFYLNYFSARSQGLTRSQSFCAAQQAYAQALMEDSRNGIRMNGNYQFNLCNLLAYHNFGVLEPKSSISPDALKAIVSNVPDTTTVYGSITVENARLPVYEDTLGDKKVVLHSVTYEQQSDGSWLYTLDFTGDPWLNILIFDPPNAKFVRITHYTSGEEHQTRSFTLTQEQLAQISDLVVNFYVDDTQRAFVSLPLPK